MPNYTHCTLLTQPYSLAFFRSLLGDIANGDDFSPYVTVGEVKSGNLTSLGPSEAVVAGIGNVEQVTPTNRVHLKIVEMAELKDIKVEEKPFLTAIKRVSNRQGQWVVSDMIYPKDWDGGPINRQFMITVLNSGKSPYIGDVMIYDRLTHDITFTGITKRAQITDMRELKAGLSGVPFVGLAVLAMDDFSVKNSNPEFDSSVKSDGTLSFKFKNVTLAPNDGVTVEFSVSVVKPDIDSMRKRAIPYMAIPGN